MTEGVPLVVPEVNPDAMKGMKAGKGGIIANPNCSTIIALMAVTPLHRVAKVTRMVVSTYQAASGAGAAAMAVRGAKRVWLRLQLFSTCCSLQQELEQQTREVLAGQPVTKNIFKHQVRPSRGLDARLGRAAALSWARMTHHLIYVWTSERTACGA
jgi:aspartate-semialdehyde dehydrogenase